MDQNTNGRPPMPYPDDEWNRNVPSNPVNPADQDLTSVPTPDETLHAADMQTPAEPAQVPGVETTDAWAAPAADMQTPAEPAQVPGVETTDAWAAPAADAFAAERPAADTTDQWSAPQPAMPDAATYQRESFAEPPASAYAVQADSRGADYERSEEARPKKKTGTVKSLLTGLLGGVVGAAGVTYALSATGVTGSSKVVHTTDSAAGQTININATSEDTSISKAVAAKALPSVVSVYVTSQQGQGLGSGAVLDKEGNIITNNHVVEGAEAITVTIGGKSYDATLVGTDASSDLAVVHAELNGDEVTPIEVGDSDQLVVGDWVMTLGSPFGLDQSVSAGIVSSLSRNQIMQSASGNTLYTNLIQTDAAINPGNSGGPMVNAEGKLVGIATLFSSDTESFAGIGFAIPGNYAMEIAQKIISGEPVTHAYIGLSMQTVNAKNAQENHLSVNQGAYVAEVSEDGPAAKAGIEKGDIIIGLGGEEITSADGMILAVRGHKIGETVEVKYMRGDEEKTAQVTFGDDAELQKTQKEQREQQQQQQQQEGYGIESPYGERNDYGQDVTYEDIIDYLFNNNGFGGQNQRNGR